MEDDEIISDDKKNDEFLVGSITAMGVVDDSEYDTPSFLRSKDKEKNDFSKND